MVNRKIMPCDILFQKILLGSIEEQHRAIDIWKSSIFSNVSTAIEDGFRIWADPMAAHTSTGSERSIEGIKHLVIETARELVLFPSIMAHDPEGLLTLQRLPIPDPPVIGGEIAPALAALGGGARGAHLFAVMRNGQPLRFAVHNPGRALDPLLSRFSQPRPFVFLDALRVDED
jgi:hypothetical protein